jgi:Lon protease-like protein
VLITLQARATETEPLQVEGAWRLDDCGWVANRWCELLPITQAARQKLMELPDPLVRLELVDDYLRRQGVLP